MLDLKMYINSEWRDSSNKGKREVINPANGEVFAQAAEGTVEDVREAIQVAKTAFNSGLIWLWLIEHLTYLELRIKLTSMQKSLLDLRRLTMGSR
jgi:betaine-aldehyde dehydrogenase